MSDQPTNTGTTRPAWADRAEQTGINVWNPQRGWVQPTDVDRRFAYERKVAMYWYVWGRQDAGDRSLQVGAMDAAQAAGNEALNHRLGLTSYLPSVQDQYARFVKEGI